MRIAYIYPALTTVGGADRVIVDKANYFAEVCGYDVTIITAHQNNQPLFFTLSPKVEHIDLNVDFNKQYKYNFFLRGVIYFTMLHKYKKKLSHTLYKLKVDFVLTTISRDIDFIHSINDGSFKIAEAHTPKKYLRNFHLMQERSLPYRIIGKIWTRKLENAARKFDAFVVLTQNDANDWSKIRRCNVIPNFIHDIPEISSNCHNHKIISVGRLSHEKGFDRLINIWEKVYLKFPDWELHIYGTGELLTSLSDMIENLKLGNSLFIHEPVKDIFDKYVESSIYVMTSRFEGFGMVLIEAMACGVPVIAFNCPKGPENIISDDVDGFLIEDNNFQVFEEKLSKLILEEDLRIQMGINARRNVHRYSKEVVMLQWIKLFETLQNSRKYGKY